MSLLKRVLPFGLTLLLSVSLVNSSNDILQAVLPIRLTPPDIQLFYSPCVIDEINESERAAIEKDILAAQTVYEPEDVTRQAFIWYEPQPKVSAEALKNHVNGEVILRVVLLSTGKVDQIRLLKGMVGESSDYAIDAASRIWFTSAQKDGQAVSQYATIVYQYGTR
ncbi:MAG: energy transducer TonB [Pyrinomonadaceae bacterium]